MDQQQTDLLNSLTSGQQASQQSQQLVNQLFDKMQPQLQLLINVSMVLTVIVVIVFLVGAVHKWRVQSAILRIDKNLKKFVDQQLGAQEAVPLQATDDSIEQNTH